jgi:hypothetical protein
VLQASRENRVCQWNVCARTSVAMNIAGFAWQNHGGTERTLERARITAG